MIQKLTHTTLWVLDHDAAKEFYVDKLGFKLNTDHTMDNGFRWLTVNPPEQPDLEIALMKVEPGPMMPEERATTIKKLLAEGAISGGVLGTDDCHKTYEELKAKGVEFTQPPMDRFYAVEALFKDNSGNWFSLSQEKKR